MSPPLRPSLRLALVPFNPCVGDFPGNAEGIARRYKEAAEAGAGCVVFPELAVCGYPAEDLILRPSFQRRCRETVDELALLTRDGPPLIVGTPWREGLFLYNAACVLREGAVAAIQAKRHLPNYGVFDEKRLFTRGDGAQTVEIGGVKLGLLVCEDLWRADLPALLASQGAEALLVINASPYETGKGERRRAVARQRVKETGLPLVYLNQIGGQDELIFDGGAFALTSSGGECVHHPAWEGSTVFVDLPLEPSCVAPLPRSAEHDLADDYHAMLLGLRDYAEKNRFPGVVLGLSGGIDSALTAALAADALGPERVHAVFMPSPYTSVESREDAEQQAARLGLRLDHLPIAPMMAAYGEALAPLFAGTEAGITEENLQSRIRGALLMALSNKFGTLLLTTGNKSEMSVGYATLYGDMCGGYSVLKDVYKTRVYDLARWRNRSLPSGGLLDLRDVIPERVLTKAPTAELKPGQTDQDTLPPYDVLDAILSGLVEEQRAQADLVASGHDAATVARVAQMLNRAEYKRRQAPPGVKLTSMAFGRDRRYPVTNRFIG